MKRTIKGDEYKCSNCNGVFKRLRSDEEALSESAETFGQASQSELAIVCDDCYNEIMKNVVIVEGGFIDVATS